MLKGIIIDDINIVSNKEIILLVNQAIEESRSQHRSDEDLHKDR